MGVPFLDLEFPLNDEDKDATAEQLRKMMAKQIDSWQELKEKIEELYTASNAEYRRLTSLRQRVQDLTGRAEIFFDLVESLTEATADE